MDVSEREALARKLSEVLQGGEGAGPVWPDEAAEAWLDVVDAALAEIAALRERLARAERERDALASVCDPSSQTARELAAAAIIKRDSLIPENLAYTVLLAQWGTAYRSALATPAPGGSDAE